MKWIYLQLVSVISEYSATVERLEYIPSALVIRRISFEIGEMWNIPSTPL